MWICRCELVTEGEILEATSPVRPGATTLDGVKCRTRAGYGTHQAEALLSQDPGIPSERTAAWIPAQITKEGIGSEILVGKNKETAPGEAERLKSHRTGSKRRHSMSKRTEEISGDHRAVRGTGSSAV